MRTVLFAVLALFGAAPAMAADSEMALHFGRATGGKDVDLARLTHRRALDPHARAWPTHFQIGASVWRVPDLPGTTRRYDLNATAVWRSAGPRGYLEAGFGPYLLSRTIHNETTSLPSELQFGSHVGAGLRLGERGTLGIALQHISNAGIKQPNGGIEFVLLSASLLL